MVRRGGVPNKPARRPERRSRRGSRGRASGTRPACPAGRRRVVGQHLDGAADRHVGRCAWPARSPAAGSAARGSPARRSSAARLGESARARRSTCPDRTRRRRPRRRAARPGTGPRRSAVVSRCSETRTLPWVSTPIAASTWTGRSVEAVQDEPRRHREAAPVQRVQQRLAVDVQAGEGHQVRQPVDRVADHLDVGHGRGDLGPDPVDQRGQPGRLGRGLGRAPPAAPPPPPPPPARSRAGGPAALPLVRRQRRAPPGALAHHQHADAGRAAPLVRAGRQQRPAGRAPAPGRPTGPRRRAAAPRPRRSARGRLGDRLHRADLVVGAHQAASATPGAATAAANASRSTRPAGRPARRPPRRRRRRAARRRAAPPSARSPSAPAVGRPAAGRPGRRARRAARPAVPLAVKVHLVRADAEHLGDGGRGPRRAAGGPGGLRVEPARVGPAVVQRRQQRLPGDRVQRRRGRRVQVDRPRHAARPYAADGSPPGDTRRRHPERAASSAASSLPHARGSARVAGRRHWSAAEGGHVGRGRSGRGRAARPRAPRCSC